MTLNSHFYFSKRQLDLMLKGKEVVFYRGGSRLVAGLKTRHKARQVEMLQGKIEKLTKRLKQLEGGQSCK